MLNIEPQKKKHNIKEMLDKITSEVIQGIKHGFFRYEIEGESLHSGRREIIFKAGKSHKFHIAPEDIKEL